MAMSPDIRPGRIGEIPLGSIAKVVVTDKSPFNSAVVDVVSNLTEGGRVVAVAKIDSSQDLLDKSPIKMTNTIVAFARTVFAQAEATSPSSDTKTSINSSFPSEIVSQKTSNETSWVKSEAAFMSGGKERRLSGKERQKMEDKACRDEALATGKSQNYTMDDGRVVTYSKDGIKSVKKPNENKISGPQIMVDMANQIERRTYYLRQLMHSTIEDITHWSTKNGLKPRDNWHRLVNNKAEKKEKGIRGPGTKRRV